MMQGGQTMTTTNTKLAALADRLDGPFIVGGTTYAGGEYAHYGCQAMEYTR